MDAFVAVDFHFHIEYNDLKLHPNLNGYFKQNTHKYVKIMANINL